MIVELNALQATLFLAWLLFSGAYVIKTKIDEVKRDKGHKKFRQSMRL